MTTIATDGKTMAADGLVTSGDQIFGWNLKKVFRLKDGRLVGMSGSAYNAGPFLAWLEDGGDKPELHDNFEALVLSPDGQCVSYDEHLRTIPEEVPTATGSGRMLAIGAMEAGATPEEAVRIACKRDSNTGGAIVVLDLRPIAKLEAA